jgi:hypothetical protein
MAADVSDGCDQDALAANEISHVKGEPGKINPAKSSWTLAPKQRLSD